MLSQLFSLAVRFNIYHSQIQIENEYDSQVLVKSWKMLRFELLMGGETTALYWSELRNKASSLCGEKHPVAGLAVLFYGKLMRWVSQFLTVNSLFSSSSVEVFHFRDLPFWILKNRLLFYGTRLNDVAWQHKLGLSAGVMVNMKHKHQGQAFISLCPPWLTLIKL